MELRTSNNSANKFIIINRQPNFEQTGCLRKYIISHRLPFLVAYHSILCFVSLLLSSSTQWNCKRSIS